VGRHGEMPHGVHPGACRQQGGDKHDDRRMAGADGDGTADRGVSVDKKRLEKGYDMAERWLGHAPDRQALPLAVL
jgi:hypothetical protein